MDNHDLKECFSLFATGVMIAATNVDGKNYGLTINSFSSVSLSPPLLLFSIGNGAYNLDYFKNSDSYILNILNVSQLDLAKKFAGHDHDSKWDGEQFNLTKNGNPIFHGSNAYLECAHHQIVEAGDHHIFIGQVVNFAKIRDEDGLLYYKGEFC